jgi:hypothetical protein
MRSIVPFFALALAVSAPALATDLVPVRAFRSVQLHGGGDVSIVPGPVQRVTILNGSTQFTTFRMRDNGQLQIDACNERCPRNYNLRIQIESPYVPAVAIEAGGTIVASRGFAPQRDVAAAVRAGGTIDLRALSVDEVSAAVNSGGDIYVRPRVSLAAAVHAGGDIHYSGNPQVSMAVSDGGDVSRDD